MQSDHVNDIIQFNSDTAENRTTFHNYRSWQRGQRFWRSIWQEKVGSTFVFFRHCAVNTKIQANLSSFIRPPVCDCSQQTVFSELQFVMIIFHLQQTIKLTFVSWNYVFLFKKGESNRTCEVHDC